MSTPSPTFVYKIAPHPLPSPVPSVLPLSPLDTADGFIHLSNAARIPITAGLFFNNVTAVYVYRVDSAKSTEGAGRLVWVEDEDLKGCVHLHDGKLGNEEIVGEKKYERRDGERWEDAFNKAEKVDGAWLADS